MNKVSIQRIVVLVSIALLGILGMQLYSIYSTFQLNKELFDNNVHAALGNVTARMEQIEIEQTANLYDLPRLSSMKKGNQQQLATVVDVEEISTSFTPNSLLKSSSGGDTITDTNIDQLSHRFKTSETKRSWQKDGSDAYMVHFERYFVQHGIVKDIPVEQRVSFKAIDTLIKQAFINLTKETPYVYSVYSIRKQRFILQKNKSGSYCSDYKQTTDFQYQSSLYPNSKEDIAKIYIDFPTKGHYLWSTIGFNIITTILFTGIVIACFFYTILVIWRQKKLSEMKSDFLSNMTHEFKTPIATISIATDTISHWIKKEKPEKALRFVNIIKEENRRMNSQVGKVLQMARIDKKEFRLNAEPIDVHEVITSAAEKMALQVEAKGGKIELELNASKAEIEADETHFTNIIHNLLDNANKYSPNEPHIVIRSFDTSGGIRLEVADNGLGISKDARKHIFDKFYRVPTGNIHDIKGFGLGLSYVQAIVTAHAGNIDVQSTLGKGSTFSVVFPYKHNTEA
jgi:two-component system phosphate regulon sensor histidine kinase PhoR